MADKNELMSAFEEFKAANDERLTQIEAKGKADSLTEEKVNRINEALTDLQEKNAKLEAAMNRPSGELSKEEEVSEKKAAFFAALQGKTLDTKATALVSSSDADGGYAVPEEIDRSIYDLVNELSPVRSVATVTQISTPDYKRLMNVRGSDTSWASDETTAWSDNTTPQLNQVQFTPAELITSLKASQIVIEDTFFNVEQWLTSEAAQEFALAENAGFTSGTGTNQPKGFTSYTTAATADSARAFGTLEHIVTGVADNLAATDSANADLLIDLVHKMKAGLRGNAKWMMNRAVLAELRKLKDGNNNYLWAPGLNGGTAGAILGYDVVENEDMPDLAANALPIAFGDFRRGYQIVDRVGTSVLRDPYSNHPMVTFKIRKRVDGRVTDSEAIKFLKCSV